MAESVKKSATASKPRKTPAQKAGSSLASNGSISNVEPIRKPIPHNSLVGPSHDQIAELARKYWAERGYQDGHHEEDWFRAEQALRAKAS